MSQVKESRKAPANLDNKALTILCQAVVQHFPYGEGHGKTMAAWQKVVEDFQEAHKGKNTITVQTAKSKMEMLLREWAQLDKEDHYSGVLYNEIPLQTFVAEVAAKKSDFEVC